MYCVEVKSETTTLDTLSRKNRTGKHDTVHGVR